MEFVIKIPSLFKPVAPGSKKALIRRRTLKYIKINEPRSETNVFICIYTEKCDHTAFLMWNIYMSSWRNTRNQQLPTQGRKWLQNAHHISCQWHSLPLYHPISILLDVRSSLTYIFQSLVKDNTHHYIIWIRPWNMNKISAFKIRYVTMWITTVENLWLLFPYFYTETIKYIRTVENMLLC